MARLTRCAVGFSVHTGWAACCVISAELRAPAILARERIELLGDAQRFVFHRAAELNPTDGRRSVADARVEAARAAKRALEGLVERARAEGLTIVGCAVVARQGTLPPLAEIVKAHPRIHTAEGGFFRDVLIEAAAAQGIAAQIVPPKELDALAAKTLGMPAAQLATLLAAAGKRAGPPWGRDEKLAALAAWTLLSAGPNST